MNKRKIINDPVFGFISIPSDFLYGLLQHPYFQRLNRIKQLGLSCYVYPGAQHTRFLHSLGAMHLTNEAIQALRSKGEDISAEEADGVLAAILLHDIGHGPFSHVMEDVLVDNVSHESLSLLLMQRMNREMDGALDVCISIFTDSYPKRFLHQLVSSQLDMDRLDYLRRDSFFTGVIEGVIGSARIIKMLRVVNDRLVVEEKGIYSIENFLIARRFMYWQVYLHKTSLSAELMLHQILRRAKYLVRSGKLLFASPSLLYFLKNSIGLSDFENDDVSLGHFVCIDDSDVMNAIKVWSSDDDVILSLLSGSFMGRRLYKVAKMGSDVWNNRVTYVSRYMNRYGISEQECDYLLRAERVSSRTYNPESSNIMILKNSGELLDISSASEILDVDMLKHKVSKDYLFYLP